MINYLILNGAGAGVTIITQVFVIYDNKKCGCLTLPPHVPPINDSS